MAGTGQRKRGYHYNAGFLTNARVRRILQLSGYDLKLGKPTSDDDVLVWGHSPYAPRGEAVAQATGAHLVRVEDAFLRSLHPGRSGEPPLGLVIDRKGLYFDATRPSDLEVLLSTHPLDDTGLLDRARDALARIGEGHLTKYACRRPDTGPACAGLCAADRPDARRCLDPAGAGQCRQFRRNAGPCSGRSPGRAHRHQDPSRNPRGPQARPFRPHHPTPGVTLDDRIIAAGGSSRARGRSIA